MVHSLLPICNKLFILTLTLERKDVFFDLCLGLVDSPHGEGFNGIDNINQKCCNIRIAGDDLLCVAIGEVEYTKCFLIGLWVRNLFKDAANCVKFTHWCAPFEHLATYSLM